ncbi:MAG: DUF4344 domain-containing metallopeptidase [Bosea sp. (in: a-proteobacteria)]
MAACACLLVFPTRAADTSRAPYPPAVINIVHEPPTNPAHQAVFEHIRTDATFAKSRDFFTLFRLPREMTFRTRNCSGRGGAWYYEGTVTICYEYLQTVIDNARSPARPAWVSEAEAISGPIADVVLHEGAHALFEFLRTPLLGREEDAADMVATFALLNMFKTDAKALVSGIAYSYLNDAKARNFSDLPTLENRVVPSRAYGGAHSTALQRLFSVVCHASGSDEAAFKELVAMSELPPWRAGGCEDEYKQISHAFHTLLGPHMDRDKAQAMFPGSKFLPAE